MEFSQDWFSHNIPNFEHIKTILTSKKRILEVGCFEGRATCWMLENLLDDNGQMTCVDTFEGSEEHENLTLTLLFERWKQNVDWVRKQGQLVTAYKGKSSVALANLISQDEKYDFIYIDGSHQAPDVMTDGCMAWQLLNENGIMLFDDYLWQDVPGMLHRPKIAIDMFTTLFAEQAELVLCGYQLGIWKLPTLPLATPVHAPSTT